jgi:hypothetical protein
VEAGIKKTIMENTQNQPQREMPRYQSHKTVHALKIKSIEYHEATQDGKFGATITPEDEGFGKFDVPYHSTFSADTVDERPRAGMYYVVYGGGYFSFSPASAFEEGYTLIN